MVEPSVAGAHDLLFRGAGSCGSIGLSVVVEVGYQLFCTFVYRSSGVSPYHGSVGIDN